MVFSVAGGRPFRSSHAVKIFRVQHGSAALTTSSFAPFGKGAVLLRVRRPSSGALRQDHYSPLPPLLRKDGTPGKSRYNDGSGRLLGLLEGIQHRNLRYVEVFERTADMYL